MRSICTPRLTIQAGDSEPQWTKSKKARATTTCRSYRNKDASPIALLDSLVSTTDRAGCNCPTSQVVAYPCLAKTGVSRRYCFRMRRRALSAAILRVPTASVRLMLLRALLGRRTEGVPLCMQDESCARKTLEGGQSKIFPSMRAESIFGCWMKGLKHPEPILTPRISQAVEIFDIGSFQAFRRDMVWHAS